MTNIVKLKHERAGDFRSLFASAMTASKTGDGMLQMTFYRDAIRIIDEDVTLSQAIDPQAPPSTPVQILGSQNNVEQYREDVVTVAIPVSSLDSFAKLLNQLNAGE